MKRETHIIDGKDKLLGRLATEVSVLIRGKHKPGFQYHKDEGDFVIVENSDKIRVTGKKRDKKIYYRHSGYLGSLKGKTMKELELKKPGEILRKAVMGMLPKNRLASSMIKRLKFK